MDKQGKIWGHTSNLLNKNNVEVHRIEGNSGSYCSEHKHDHKFNMFFVEKGSIIIKRWKVDYDLVDSTHLGAGSSCVVPPGEYHQFIVNEDCIVYEFYWVEIDTKDIKRKNVGGIGND